jgi:general stress protein YciG
VKVRVALAAAQLINYHERFAFGVPLLRRLGATFKARKKAFTPEYAEKTAAEFMAACHDKRRSDDAREGGGAGGGDDSNDDDDDALDDALEAMLDAQANATGNLYDDYDEDD